MDTGTRPVDTARVHGSWQRPVDTGIKNDTHDHWPCWSPVCWVHSTRVHGTWIQVHGPWTRPVDTGSVYRALIESQVIQLLNQRMSTHIDLMSEYTLNHIRSIWSHRTCTHLQSVLVQPNAYVSHGRSQEIWNPFPLPSFSLPTTPFPVPFPSLRSYLIQLGGLGTAAPPAGQGGAKRFCVVFSANLHILHARTDAIFYYFLFKFYTAVVQIYLTPFSTTVHQR